METLERQSVRRALDELKPFLRAYVEQRCGTLDREARRTPSAEPDIAGLLKTMLDRWSDVFARELGPATRSYVHELKDVRNRWAHEAPFTPEEARRAVDTAAMLARAIGMPLPAILTGIDAGAHAQPVKSREPVTIVEPTLLFRITRSYRPDMSPLELYEATRGVWRVSERRKEIRFAMPVFQGEVVEVFEIERWVAAGTTAYKSRTRAEVTVPGRWEFEGRLADESVRKRYIGMDVSEYFARGSMNPVAYAP